MQIIEKMTDKTIILIRHSNRYPLFECNKLPFFPGSGITDIGKEKCKRLKLLIEERYNISSVFSSNTARTIETAELLSDKEVLIDDSLSPNIVYNHLMNTYINRISEDTDSLRNQLEYIFGCKIEKEIDYYQLYTTIKCYDENLININIDQNIRDIIELISIKYLKLLYQNYNDTLVYDLIEKLTDSSILVTYDIVIYPLMLQMGWNYLPEFCSHIIFDNGRININTLDFFDSFHDYNLSLPKNVFVRMNNIKINCLFGVRLWVGGFKFETQDRSIVERKIIEVATRLGKRIPGYFINESKFTIFKFTRIPRRKYTMIDSVDIYQNILSILVEELDVIPIFENTDSFSVSLGLMEGYYNGIKSQILSNGSTKEELIRLFSKKIQFQSDDYESMLEELKLFNFEILHTKNEAEEFLGIEVSNIDLFVINPEYNYIPYTEPAIRINFSHDKIEKVIELANMWKQSRLCIESNETGTSVNLEILEFTDFF